MVVVVVFCLGGLTAVSAQVRCVDAAREAARLAARGDERSAAEAVRIVGPGGAGLQLRRDGDFVIATVSARASLLPGIAIAAEAVAATEPAG